MLKKVVLCSVFFAESLMNRNFKIIYKFKIEFFCNIKSLLSLLLIANQYPTHAACILYNGKATVLFVGDDPALHLSNSELVICDYSCYITFQPR